MSQVENAVACFQGGCSCSQAILSIYGARFGLDRETALRLAAGFGGGMGRMGEVCGAVTGAFMVLGLMNESADKSAKANVAMQVREFAKAFKARQGSLICRELLGMEILTDEGMQAAKEQGLIETRCVQCVRDAAEILEQLTDLQEPTV